MAYQKTIALSLYRSVLRSHRKNLPPQMRSLGDAYVKTEFRANKTLSEKRKLDEFFTAWGDYLKRIDTMGRAKNVMSSGREEVKATFGEDLPSGLDLSDEQRKKLVELRHEATKAGGGKTL
eukprot:CAMPEP_0172507544 /NCGR_PEP_ID=MMETSP1066-20121228/204459_1 /TAXON_ID=671091 /ORGANISM="Coscinodiscus wailesii, Strain CCMP2513" /LENGTH=120 /DNA_ID=CAMNT_0013285117 /DNA_START=55 /DNA_END=417 /DNA_ORIENTATION=+